MLRKHRLRRETNKKIKDLQKKLYNTTLKLEDSTLPLHIRNEFRKKYKHINTIPRELNVPQKKNFLVPWKNVQASWWYFTGHLHDQAGNAYGYEITFFKFTPFLFNKVVAKPLYAFFKNAVLIAHFALTDVSNRTFSFAEKSMLLGNEGRLSFSQLSMSLDDWYLHEVDNVFMVRAYDKKKNIDLLLELKPVKPLIAQGNKGYSLKSQKPRQASYYGAYTRIHTTGLLKKDGELLSVSGDSWFDHEKVHVPVHQNVRGWNWFAVMLDNHTEIMFYHIIDKKGISEKYSIGSFIDKKGKKHKIHAKNVNIKPLNKWTSPETKITYDVGWHMKIKEKILEADLLIIPVLPNQEINSEKTTIITYWEGKCHVTGAIKNKRITGNAYVELAGKVKPLVHKLAHLLLKV